jgi:hypothetical protein
MPSGAQEAVYYSSERLVDDLPLRCADRFEQRPVSRRQTLPGRLQDTRRSLDLRDAQPLSALRISHTNHGVVTSLRPVPGPLSRRFEWAARGLPLNV